MAKVTWMINAKQRLNSSLLTPKVHPGRGKETYLQLRFLQGADSFNIQSPFLDFSITYFVFSGN